MSSDPGERLRLSSADLEVVITPAKGADICSLVDRASGTDVLFKTPWPQRDPHRLPPYGSTQADWLARYPGGWQILLPHAGPERAGAAGPRGYHGEAALLPWALEQHSATDAVLVVELFTAPLRITREIALDGAALQVIDTVHNLSDVPVEFAWVHHPAFGPPFVGPECTVRTGAATLVTDPAAPGTLFAAGQTMPTADLRAADGSRVDLATLPGPTERREIFAALTDFGPTGWFSLTNPRLGFGLRMEWNTDVLPHAWCWQECHASRGFPWFRRAYAVGLEPANVLPAQTLPDAGGAPSAAYPSLEPSGSVTSHLTLTRFPAT